MEFADRQLLRREIGEALEMVRREIGDLSHYPIVDAMVEIIEKREAAQLEPTPSDDELIGEAKAWAKDDIVPSDVQELLIELSKRLKFQLDVTEYEKGHWFASVDGIQGAWGDGTSPEEAVDELKDAILGWVELKMRKRGTQSPSLPQNEISELIEAAVKEIQPNVPNETAAWNLWNNLNTSPAFIKIFLLLHKD